MEVAYPSARLAVLEGCDLSVAFAAAVLVGILVVRASKLAEGGTMMKQPQVLKPAAEAFWVLQVAKKGVPVQVAVAIGLALVVVRVDAVVVVVEAEKENYPVFLHRGLL